MRQFHISDILSVTSNLLLSSRHIDGVYDILGYMTGERVFTHQIPRVSDECRQVLIALHPQLATADVEDVTPENHAERIARWVQQFGETLPVRKLTEDEHERIDPESEMAEMMHPGRILKI